VLVNTSFNVRSEPIVCTPEDAFRCFMGNEIELLVVGNCMLRKDKQNPALKLNYKDQFQPDWTARTPQPRALGRKVSDEFVVPLCREHHRAVHRSHERAWWRQTSIDPIKVVRRLCRLHLIHAIGSTHFGITYGQSCPDQHGPRQ
jgi:Carbamoyltransferase C-terminus